MAVHPFFWLALSFFGYYFAYGVTVPFIPVWLKSRSYSAELLGLLVASSYFFRFAGGIFFAGLIKLPSQLLPMLRGLAWATAGLTAVMALVSQHFWLLFAAFGLFSMTNSAGMPMTDTLATTWQKQVSLDYGKARLIGSVAFTIAVVLFGNVIDLIGESNIIWLLTGLFVFYALIQMVKPSIAVKNASPGAATEQIGFLQLLRNKITLRLMIAACLIQGSHAGYYVYSVLYWTENGIPVGVTSLLWGLAVCAEILLFFFSKRLFKSRNIATLFYVSAAAAVIRWGAYSAVLNIGVLALLQLFHSLTFAMMHYAMVSYVALQPQHHMAKLQSLYNGLASCASVGILTAIAGMIYQRNPSMVFVVMAACAACALLIIPRRVGAVVRQY